MDEGGPHACRKGQPHYGRGSGNPGQIGIRVWSRFDSRSGWGEGLSAGPGRTDTWSSLVREKLLIILKARQLDSACHRLE